MKTNIKQLSYRAQGFAMVKCDDEAARMDRQLIYN
jgi:hypothetical protein